MKKIILALLLVTCTTIAQHGVHNNYNKYTMKKKVLFVLTSHTELGDTGKSTGFHLGEVSHPWKVLVEAGLEIDFVSPKGGKAPVDGFDLEDPINKEFWEDEVYKLKTKNTLKPSEVKVEDYNVIYYAGGHGTMWDFADNIELQTIARKIYENKGIVAAICHGPAALVNIKLSDGKYLVDGKKINSFTDAEEKALGLEKVVPFLLEAKLKERGAKFENSDLWQIHVTNDQRVITGQNPMSAKRVGEAILQEQIKLK